MEGRERHDEAPATSHKDMVATKRRKHLVRMCCLAISVMVMAIAAVIASYIAFNNGTRFLFRVNSVGIAGGMCIMCALLVLCFVTMGLNVRRGQPFPAHVRYMSTCTHIAMGFTWSVLLFGLGFGGIWGVIECSTRVRRPYKSFNLCDGDTMVLLVISASSLAILLFLIVVLLKLQCMLCSKNLGYRWQGRYLVYEGGESEGQRLQTTNQAESEAGQSSGNGVHVRYEPWNQGGATGGVEYSYPSSYRTPDETVDQKGQKGQKGQPPEPSAPPLDVPVQPPPSYSDVMGN